MSYASNRPAFPDPTPPPGEVLTAPRPPRDVPGWITIAAMLADAAFETDIDGHFTALQPEEITGRAAETLVGSSAAILFADAAGTFKEVFAAACAHALAWQGRLAVEHADGTSHRLRVALAPKFSAQGTVIGTYGMIIDLESAALKMPYDPSDQRGAELLDPETGLWSASSFIEQAARRFDRLDVEHQPGTLLLLAFSRAPKILHASIALHLSEELREIVRPTDLMCRIDRSTVGLWCDGMDHLTGGERAARLCKRLPPALPGQALISIGLATRWPGSATDPHTLLEQAGSALTEADMATGQEDTGCWRVWQAAGAETPP